MADEIKQLDLFGEEFRPKAKRVQGQVGRDNYEEFVAKFKTRLTKDDCYTPVEVYEAVLGWLREKEAQEKARREASSPQPVYEYPPEVLTTSMLGYLSVHGVEFTVMRDEVCPVPLSALAAQKAVGKAIFGKGWLISERKAAEKVIVWELSDVEREAVRRIDKKKKIKQNGND